MPVANKVKEIIVEQLGVEESKVTPEASFVDDLGVNLYTMAALFISFGIELNVDISNESAEKIITVGDAVELIEGL